MDTDDANLFLMFLEQMSHISASEWTKRLSKT